MGPLYTGTTTPRLSKTDPSRNLKSASSDEGRAGGGVRYLRLDTYQDTVGFSES